MELGLHIVEFAPAGDAAEIAPRLTDLVHDAEDAGFTRITVMDHLWQIHQVGPDTDPMLEAYTTLGFLAASTRRVVLHTLVTGVVYREPGMLAKIVTTLNVLSGGRAGLGIGAAWNGDEAAGLGLPFPGTAERFERLEEALQICLQMWAGSDDPYTGAHYQLGRTLSSPPNLSRPRIMIGGTGERKTLRLVAKYADACNLFAGPDIAHKLEVLRGHCEAEGRDYDSIEKTSIMAVKPTASAEQVVDHLRELHDVGITAAYLMLAGPHPDERVRLIGDEVIPVIASW